MVFFFDFDSFYRLKNTTFDGVLSVDWLKRRSEVDPDRIGVLGHSMGASAALQVKFILL